MPHQCTDCGRTFADGSKEMLSGCPDCGGNKFQFLPEGVDPETTRAADPSDAPEPPDPPGGEASVARTVGNAAATVREMVGGSSSPDFEEFDDSAGREAATEDVAQSDARSQVVSPEELPADTTPEDVSAGSVAPPSEDASSRQPVSTGDSTTGDSTTGDSTTGDSTTDASEPLDPPGDAATAEPTGPDEGGATEPDRPDLAQLRAELNDQFESIRVVERGQYELNLMELYDREEYIIALQEDGRYTIQVPETWRE
ncbi:MAG: Zn-ribbon containing protein [Haloarculaceae archaeon]